MFKNHTAETFKQIDRTFAAIDRSLNAQRELIKILFERIEKLEKND